MTSNLNRENIVGKYNDMRKYGYSVTILLSGVFCVFFYWVSVHLENSAIENTLTGRKMLVDLVCNTVDYRLTRGLPWEAESFKDVLAHEVDIIDEAKGTYAELFDFNLHSLSTRSPTPGIQPFALRDYPDVWERVQKEERGTAIVPFSTKKGGKTYPFHLYWRWVPSDANLGSRYLVAIGVSKHSIDVRYSNMLLYGIIVLLIVSSLNSFRVNVVLCELGAIKDMRKGDDPWRQKTS